MAPLTYLPNLAPTGHPLSDPLMVLWVTGSVKSTALEPGVKPQLQPHSYTVPPLTKRGRTPLITRVRGQRQLLPAFQSG